MKQKRSTINEKQAVLVAVKRQGSVRSALVDNDKAAELGPWIERFVQKDANLMTDENRTYPKIGKHYAAHSSVNHNAKSIGHVIGMKLVFVGITGSLKKRGPELVAKKNCDDCNAGIRFFLLFVKPRCWTTNLADKKRRHILP